ncbi:MAG: isopentenyl phosphate kinase [archaeon]
MGGSVITEKQRPYTTSSAAIEAAMRTIAESHLKKVIVIHGGGSFGHPTASRYNLQGGFREPEQVLGLARTRQAMMELNKIVIDAGVKERLPCVSIAPSSFVQTENKRIVRIETAIVNSLLNLGAVPVLFGDVVMDRQIGFCILSGDQLAAKLAMELNAGRVIFAVDVDGVYDSNPKLNPEAKLIEILDSRQAKQLIDSEKISEHEFDVTGGMLAKIAEMLPLTQRGVTVMFINGRKPAVLLDALKGIRTVGTTMRQAD